MKKRLLFVLCLFFVGTSAAKAQTKTVTNADLEKFRQKRLQAEKEYGENYARLGFPSPAELEKQREVDRKNLSEASARLQKEEAEREQRRREEDYRNAQYNAMLAIASQNSNRGAYVYNSGGGGFYGAYPIYGNGFYRGGGFYRRDGFGRGGFYGNPFGGFNNFGNRGNGVRVTVTGTFGSGGGFGRPH